MKKLIFLLLLIGGAVYAYNKGYFGAIKLSPAEFAKQVTDAAKSAAGALEFEPLPLKAPERNWKPGLPSADFVALETVVMASRNAKAAYALAEFAYGTGLPEGGAYIRRYLAAFTRPSEKNRILTLVTKYKDKESLDLLESFLTRGTFARKTVLGHIADYKTPEAAQIIMNAADSPTPAINTPAKAMLVELNDQPWFSHSQGKRTLAGKHTADIINIPLVQ